MTVTREQVESAVLAQERRQRDFSTRSIPLPTHLARSLYEWYRQEHPLPKAPEGFELTGEYRQPTPSEWFLGNDGVQHVWPRWSTLFAPGPRYILREVKLSKREVLARLLARASTLAEWDGLREHVRDNYLSDADWFLDNGLEEALADAHA